MQSDLYSGFDHKKQLNLSNTNANTISGIVPFMAF